MEEKCFVGGVYAPALETNKLIPYFAPFSLHPKCLPVVVALCSHLNILFSTYTERGGDQEKPSSSYHCFERAYAHDAETMSEGKAN